MDFAELRSLIRRAEEFARPSLLVREQLGLEGSTVARAIREADERASLASQFVTGIGGASRVHESSTAALEWQRQDRLRASLGGPTTSELARAAQSHFDSPTMRAAMGYLDSPSMKAASGYLDSDTMRAVRGLADTASAQAARAVAESASALTLPSGLDAYRLSTKSLADRLTLFDTAVIAHDRVAIEAFASGAAVSDALALATRVDRSLIDATRAFSRTALPDLGSWAAHRAFLDASGLWLPRYPRVRLLTTAEKRRRFRARLQRNAEPPHVKRAKSLVHRYERVLREIIDAAMAAEFGEDWTTERLPECGCNTLLGRAAARGGDPLDHADYAHYRDIMSHPDHHSRVFAVAFDDPTALATLIDDAGRLRARSHHAGDFAPDDLRDLRLVWRTIEAGLLALTEDFAVDYLR
jgi:hypothetical protein